MKKVLLFLVVLITLSSCEKDPKETTQNGNFIIEFLFEQNGCKMYRFEDGGRNVYWCDCQGKVNSDYTTTSGKSTTTHHIESITCNNKQTND